MDGEEGEGQFVYPTPSNCIPRGRRNSTRGGGGQTNLHTHAFCQLPGVLGQVLPPAAQRGRVARWDTKAKALWTEKETGKMIYTCYHCGTLDEIYLNIFSKNTFSMLDHRYIRSFPLFLTQSNHHSLGTVTCDAPPYSIALNRRVFCHC